MFQWSINHFKIPQRLTKLTFDVESAFWRFISSGWAEFVWKTLCCGKMFHGQTFLFKRSFCPESVGRRVITVRILSNAYLKICLFKLVPTILSKELGSKKTLAQAGIQGVYFCRWLQRSHISYVTLRHLDWAVKKFS